MRGSYDGTAWLLHCAMMYIRAAGHNWFRGEGSIDEGDIITSKLMPGCRIEAASYILDL